jgi:AcrR family transcriptional regulator
MASARKSSKPARRRVGRPRGDAPDLRERLIDAAITEFARIGIGATSLRAVAQAAGATPAMLHYYFGDKQQMTMAMVNERLLPAAAPLRARIEAAGDEPTELAEAFVGGMADMIAAHPWLPALWVREVLCEGGALREIVFKRAVPQMPQLLAQRFAAAQARGRLDRRLDPRLMVVSLVGMTLLPAAGAPIWRKVFDASDLDSAALQKHVLALLDHGMGARARARRSAS